MSESMNTIELALGYECNAPCRFCTSWNTQSGAVSFETAAARMRAYRESGAAGIIFGGGEPSIHPDFLTLVKQAKTLGYSKIEVKTNGIRFCYPEFAAACMSAGVDSFSVSLWGHDPASHDLMAGRTGAFEMTEMGIKHLLHYGADIKIDFLESTSSCGHEKPLLTKFASMGLKRIDLWLFCIFGAGGTGKNMVPLMKDAGLAAVELAELLAPLGCRVRTSHVPPCCMKGRVDLYLNIAAYSLEIVTPNGHSFKAQDSPFEAGRHIEPCTQCACRHICPGPRIEYVDEFGGSEFHPVVSL